MKRNPSIELFRCACMFGVCLLHALTQGGYAGPHRGLDNLMTPSVVGFLFISGWFGIRLKVGHVAKLMGVGLYCAATLAIVYQGGWLGQWSAGALFGHFWQHFSGSWFLWCYFALMLIAPAFEPLFAKKPQGGDMDILKFVLPLLILVFGWSYAATKIPVLKAHTPHVGGFGAFGVLTFVGIYVAARTCRYYDIEKYLSTRRLLLIAAVSGAFCWIGFMHYHSPFAFVFAGSVFFLFKRIKIRSPRMERAILFLSPSMFSVYLLHNSGLGMTWLRNTEDALLGAQEHNYYLVCFGVAAVLFLGSLLLDLPRRMVLRVVKKAKGQGEQRS